MKFIEWRIAQEELICSIKTQSYSFRL